MCTGQALGPITQIKPFNLSRREEHHLFSFHPFQSETLNVNPSPGSSSSIAYWQAVMVCQSQGRRGMFQKQRARRVFGEHSKQQVNFRSTLSALAPLLLDKGKGTVCFSVAEKVFSAWCLQSSKKVLESD